MKTFITSMIMLLATSVFACDEITTTTSVVQQSCPDCICKPADVSCPACPDTICPECPACNCNCPDPCPSPCDTEEDVAGTYTIMGVGTANGWANPEVTLGTFTIFPKGDFGWGYQCMIAGGVDRRGCQTYFLKKR